MSGLGSLKLFHDARIGFLLVFTTNPNTPSIGLILFGALLAAFGVASCLARLRAMELKLVALRWAEQALANGALIDRKVFIVYVDTNQGTIWIHLSSRALLQRHSSIFPISSFFFLFNKLLFVKSSVRN